MFRYIISIYLGLHLLLNFSVTFGNITLNTGILDKNFGNFFKYYSVTITIVGCVGDPDACNRISAKNC